MVAALTGADERTSHPGEVLSLTARRVIRLGVARQQRIHTYSTDGNFFAVPESGLIASAANRSTYHERREFTSRECISTFK